MMKFKKLLIFTFILLLFLAVFLYAVRIVNFNSEKKIGQKADSLNGVMVYYNGGVHNILERNRTADGYNLGMKYQCVEFVKRYYYEVYDHRMPDSYGNAKDFFDPKLKDGAFSEKRGLFQHSNPGYSKPQTGDLLIYSPTIFNKFGHVSIVAKVGEQHIEIIQQNPGPFSSSREKFNLVRNKKTWEIGDTRILGWLRKEKTGYKN